MTPQIIRHTEYSTSNWSGGTTTQLFIYPPGSSYAERNFSFRISSATVEVEKSQFTSLPGFKRILMVLDGELHLHHKDHYDKSLRQFEQDSFDGAWETSAEGKVIDFNLIFSPGASASVRHAFLGEDKKCALDFSGFAFLYVHEGSIKINSDNEQLVEVKDSVVLKRGGSIIVSALRDAHLIIGEIRFED